MDGTISCAHCGHVFTSNPRVKNQRYCGQAPCQRARKRKWQKEKLATDDDYKANQRACQIDWHRQRPDYYIKYRQSNPRYCQRNTLLQIWRNAKARAIAKMDASEAAPINKPKVFYLLPLIAKMDVSVQKVLIIPVGYVPQCLIAKEDSMAARSAAC